MASQREGRAFRHDIDSASLELCISNELRAFDAHVSSSFVNDWLAMSAIEISILLSDANKRNASSVVDNAILLLRCMTPDRASSCCSNKLRTYRHVRSPRCCYITWQCGSTSSTDDSRSTIIITIIITIIQETRQHTPSFAKKEHE